MAELNPEDFNFFRQSKRRIQDSYLLGAEQNKFQTDVAGAEWGRNLGDLTRKFAEMRRGIPGGFAKRGMLNSGAYQRGLTDFATSKADTLRDAQARHSENIWGLALAKNQLEAVRTNATFDIDEQEKARRAAIAAAINPNMAGV